MTTSLPQSAVNGFHSGSVLLGAANAIEDDAKASAGDTIISMDGIQVIRLSTAWWLVMLLKSEQNTEIVVMIDNFNLS